jgi:hypothetical protein
MYDEMEIYGSVRCPDFLNTGFRQKVTYLPRWFFNRFKFTQGYCFNRFTGLLNEWYAIPNLVLPHDEIIGFFIQMPHYLNGRILVTPATSWKEWKHRIRP